MKHKDTHLLKNKLGFKEWADKCNPDKTYEDYINHESNIREETRHSLAEAIEDEDYELAVILTQDINRYRNETIEQVVDRQLDEGYRLGAPKHGEKECKRPVKPVGYVLPIHLK